MIRSGVSLVSAKRYTKGNRTRSTDKQAADANLNFITAAVFSVLKYRIEKSGFLSVYRIQHKFVQNHGTYNGNQQEHCPYGKFQKGYAVSD